jgi:hypothetical protein
VAPDDTTPAAPEPRHVDEERLFYAVAGVLFLHQGVHPNRPVHVQRELEKLGIVASPEQISAAVQSCRERGLDVAEEADQYTARGWTARPRITWVSE